MLYKSKYGFTKRYAEWIASDLKADLCEVSEVTARALDKYSTVVFGGSLYINRLSGINTLLKYQRRLIDKKIIIFTCGLSDPNNERSTERIKNAIRKKIPGILAGNVNMFHLRGGVDYAKLKFLDSLILGFLEKMLKKSKQEELPPEQRELAAVLGKDFDFSSSEQIKTIIEFALKDTALKNGD